MNLSTKHQNQSVTTLQNFAGGLNTSLPAELIDAAQLSELVNMEIDSSGLLRTVRGTRNILDMTNASSDIISAAWDGINAVLLLFLKNGAVYAFDGNTVKQIGELSGTDEVITVGWEDGLLIASGGYLQYAKYVVNNSQTVGEEPSVYSLVTLTSSPNDCGGVYVRSGRVFVFDDEDNIRYSAVGNEEEWTEDSNDPSAAIFTQIGYKVGGRIIGLINFQSYILIIKDNGKIYRLENEYPDWAIKEVTSNGLCKGKAAYASVGSSVMVLGEKTLQSISPTDDYGNMPISFVGKQVAKEIESLPPWTKMRYVTELNQLWFITNSQWVLVYDCNTQSFFQRYFNSDVVDVVGNYIIKRDNVCLLSADDEVLEDNGEPLQYKAVFKTEMGLNDILVKHIDLSVSPLVSYYDSPDATLTVGRINVSFPKRVQSLDNTRQVTVGVTDTATEPRRLRLQGERNAADTEWSNKLVGDGFQDVSLNPTNIAGGKPLLYKKRQVCRCDRVGVSLKGSGFPFMLNFISYYKAEV